MGIKDNKSIIFGLYCFNFSPYVHLQILFAPSERLRLRTYNVTGFSCSPAQLADAIRQYLPHFEISYEICPIRQRIGGLLEWSDQEFTVWKEIRHLVPLLDFQISTLVYTS